MGSALAAERPTAEVIRLGPQPGPQKRFADCRTDMAIIGGSVYGGKSWALTYQPLAHIDNPGFRCVTFRRIRPEIRAPGGLWDESIGMYPLLEGRAREQHLDWIFPNGARIQFDGCQYDADARSWKSSQIALLQFDQAEEFTEYQWWYLHSRNRTTCGMNAYSRAGCNAMADSWLADFIQWWWDPETGYAIGARSGIARFFIRVDDVVQWSSVTIPCDTDARSFERATREATAELERRFPGRAINPKTGRRNSRSFAFIRAEIKDNVLGVQADPDYEARVRMGSYVEQERLLGGNWKIRAAAGLVFDRADFEIVEAAPAGVKKRVRYWDKAGTAGGGDWTVGTLESEEPRDQQRSLIYVEDVIRGQWRGGERERIILETAKNDPPGTEVVVEQEPGSGGRDAANYTIDNLSGYPVWADRPSGQLTERAQPLAAQAQVHNVKLVRGPWNGAWLAEMHAFPTKGIPDDQVASAVGGFKFLRFGRIQPPRKYTIVRPHA